MKGMTVVLLSSHGAFWVGQRNRQAFKCDEGVGQLLPGCGGVSLGLLAKPAA